MPNSILSLIQQGEHQTQDFKFRIDDQKKIARTLSAFANTDGGRLLIGVKDNGKITGINPEEEFHMIEGAAQLYCKPPLTFESKVWQENFRMILEILIPKNEEKNTFALDENGKWKIYIRKEDHTLLANKILLNVWTLQKKGIPKPQEFGNEELEFIKLFSEINTTLSKLYKSSKLKKGNVDQLLSLFVYWGIVNMDINEDGTFYRLA